MKRTGKLSKRSAASASRVPSRTTAARNGKGLVAIRRLGRGSPIEVIERIREGLPATAFDQLAGFLAISRKRLCDALGVRPSTISGRIRNHRLLPANDTSKVICTAKVIERAADVLGSSDMARQWLQQELRSIGGVPPITLLDTHVGCRLLLDTLGRIEQGIAA
jgi:putative toxin-antitoxin system antitoxin component (TIGR02293 family)